MAYFSCSGVSDANDMGTVEGGAKAVKGTDENEAVEEEEEDAVPDEARVGVEENEVPLDAKEPELRNAPPRTTVSGRAKAK